MKRRTLRRVAARAPASQVYPARGAGPGPGQAAAAAMRSASSPTSGRPMRRHYHRHCSAAPDQVPRHRAGAARATPRNQRARRRRQSQAANQQPHHRRRNRKQQRVGIRTTSGHLPAASSAEPSEARGAGGPHRTGPPRPCCITFAVVGVPLGDREGRGVAGRAATETVPTPRAVPSDGRADTQVGYIVPIRALSPYLSPQPGPGPRHGGRGGAGRGGAVGQSLVSTCLKVLETVPLLYDSPCK